MPNILNSFDGGTAGVDISTANSGGTSGTAFDTVNGAAGTTVQFDSTHTAHGSLALIVDPGATITSPHVRWSTAMGGAYGTAWARFYVYMTGYPTATGRLFEARSGASVVAATLRVNPAGTWAIGGTSGASNTSTGSIPLNQWVRFEAKVVGSATTGQVVASLYSSMDSVTATETLTSITTLNTTGTINETRFGLLVAATSGDPAIWLDDLAVSSTAALGPVATVPTPNTVLNIGTGAGKNYFKLQYARPGDGAIITKTLAELSASFSASPYYVTTTDGLRVHFEARLDAPTTAGAASSRAELREVDSAGADIAWNPLTAEHIMQGTTIITGLPPVLPEVVIAQVFGNTATADIVSLRTQLVSGTIRLRARINGVSVTSPEIASPYATGTEFTWKIRFAGGIAEIYWVVGSTTLPGTPNVTSSAITETSAYFKAGLYNQSNVAAGDAGTAIGAAEHRLLTVTHTTPTAITSTNTGTGTDAGSVAATANAVDAGAGTDTATLAQQYAATDSGTGADSIALMTVDTKTVTETGTGSDSIFVDIPVLKSAADTAAGSDSISIGFVATATDAGTGTESTAIAQASATTDQGTGSESVALLRQDTVADVGTGSESVALQRQDIATDAGTGSESATIAQFSSVTEAGTATESTAIAQASATVDPGTGSDSVAVQRASTVTDAGTGSQTVALQRLATIAETGIGVESFAIARFSAVTDTAIGTQLVSGGPFTNDHGVGTDQIDVVVIPFTQVLPLKLSTVYDVVVVARVPQVNGVPQYIEIDPIEWKSVQYANALSQPQELSVSCQLSSITEPVLQRLRDLAGLATEIWLYRNGKVVFAGPIQGFQTSGEDLTIKAKGLLAYLRLMIVTQDMTFTAVDHFSIVKAWVDQWQALDYGNFGIDTSTVGLQGQVHTGTYLQEELKNVGSLIEELGKAASGFDAEVDPASRKLQLWAPGKGVDRSDGEDAIVIDSRNITSSDILCSVAIGDLASEAFGTGSSPGADKSLYSVKSNLELRAKYGRSAITGAFSDANDQSLLDSWVQGLLSARGDALIVPGPKVRVTPDADLVDYSVGDTVAYELSGQIGISGAFRIRKQTVNAAPTGQESVDLEFV